MATFSDASKAKLATCDERLQRVFNEVIKHFDCVIIEGHRGREDQNRYYNEGKSKLAWPQGEHNSIPSKAVDAMPYPIDWKDINRMCYFAGFVVATGISMGIKIRWGKDWDMDTDLNDQSFQDAPHYELVG